MLEKIKPILIQFSNDSLYRNSIYLILSTAVVALLGFLFWILCARLYSPEHVGIATTLVSIVTLISNFGLLGLNNSVIRYLQKSKKQVEMVNTSLLLVTVTSLLLGLVYLLLLKTFTPSLEFLLSNYVYSILFVIFTCGSALNLLSESIFIAYRNSKYVFIKNCILSVVKLIIPLVTVTLGGFGIFFAVGTATVAAVAFSIGMLIKRFKYRVTLAINKRIITETKEFSFANYIASFIGTLPTMILPILITNHLGAKVTAFFYMPMMIANFLYIIPQSTTKSFFAEGSFNEDNLRVLCIKAFKMTIVMIIPSIILIIFLGNFVLSTFGEEYASEGLLFLQLLAISGLFISVNSIIGTILNIKNKLKEIVFINVISSSLIILLSFLNINSGLKGIGISWAIGQAVMSVVYILYFGKLYYVKQQTLKD